MRRFPAFWVALGLALGLGCPGQPDDPGSSSLLIRVTDEDGAPLVRFQLTAELGQGAVETVYCSPEVQEETSRVACVTGGVELDDPVAPLAVVVKSKGWSTIQASFEEVSGERSDGPGGARVIVSLDRLPSFEATEDYRGGFSLDDGLREFEELAVSAPSELGRALVVKFLITGLDSEPQVYFQNTGEHPLHYGFARRVLGLALSLEEYEEQAYHGEDRQFMAGSVILYPDLALESACLGDHIEAPVTIEFFPSDDLSPALALRAYRLIEERVLFAPLFGETHRLFYLPASEARDRELLEETSRFEAFAGLWLHRDELYGGVRLQLLNQGVGFGTLRVMSPEELEVAPVSYQDIVVLTRLPNEAPLAGGTITEELQTPLAHVNVAARARGTPNMALLEASRDERIAPLVGRLVRFEVTDLGFSLAEASLEEAEAFWSGLFPEEVTTPGFDVERRGLLRFSEIGFDDALAVGVKAANLAELSQLLPENAPDGFAVPFFYYDQFMSAPVTLDGLCQEARDDCLDEGRPAAVCAEVADFCVLWERQESSLSEYVELLLQDGTFNSDTVYREAALDGVRYLIHHVPVDAEFASALDGMVREIFGTATVRLRSSTNAEDLPNFSGAGLYRSESAEVGDRVPSSRIRKIWGSVFNFRAFEERTFWNIDQRAVRMGVAVHGSYPDEAANGVLITQNISDPAAAGFYVNVQLGEESVTNPSGGALPEIFVALLSGGGRDVVRQRYSSLSPAEPIMTDAEIEALFQAARTIQQHFAALYGADAYTLALDMEFKLHGPDRQLIIKQVRPYFDLSR
jgi:hypothetical protein